MLDKEGFRKVYGMFEEADPLPYDCGKDCGAVCCRNDSFDDGTDPYIYLLPGEKEYLEDAGADIEISRDSSRAHDLPESYGEYVYLAACNGPEACERRFRPIQCRSFPLWPRIDGEGELVLAYYDDELPYVCPLIREGRKLQEDFVKAAYEAWEILMQDEAIKDLIVKDSSKLSLTDENKV